MMMNNQMFSPNNLGGQLQPQDMNNSQNNSFNNGQGNSSVSAFLRQGNSGAGMIGMGGMNMGGMNMGQGGMGNPNHQMMAMMNKTNKLTMHVI